MKKATSSAVKKITVTGAPKAKKPRKKISMSSILGVEPRLIMPDNIKMVSALNWYNAVADSKEQRVAWVLTFMDDQGHYSKEEKAEFKRKGKKFSLTYSAIARMLQNGCVLEDHVTDNVNKQIADFIGISDSEDLDEDGQLIVTTPVKKKATDTSYDDACLLVEYIDGEMDAVLAGGKGISMYEALTRRGITSKVARMIKDYYKPQAFEFAEVLKGNDEQLEEGYSHLTKKVRKAMSTWMTQLVADLASLEHNKKATRQPRKKRAVKVENVVKHVKYLKESTEFKVKSIDPVKAVGAKGLWVFNTKTRQLGLYTATDDKGITFKGTTIVNATGNMKKLRDASLFLQDFGGTAKSMENKLKAVKATLTPMNGRINAHIILLKVI